MLLLQRRHGDLQGLTPGGHVTGYGQPTRCVAESECSSMCSSGPSTISIGSMKLRATNSRFANKGTPVRGSLPHQTSLSGRGPELQPGKRENDYYWGGQRKG